MLLKKGFDSNKYVEIQTKEINKRVKIFDRLYIEFGGHLCFDGHASRVLPGYNPRNKIKILKKLKDVEVIYCVSAKDLETKKRLGDFKLDYKKQTLKDLSELKKFGLKIFAVVITRFSGEKNALEFKRILSKYYSVYVTPEIKDYVKDAKSAIKGYEKYTYIPVKSKIIIVTGAAGGSGKMACAMSQIHHEVKLGLNTGYAKFESFPVWNLPLDSKINIAYEAATADLGDYLEIDPYHLKNYKINAVNYNRDIENFEILIKIAKHIRKERNAFGYLSPTDMGINMIKLAIINLDVCEAASLEEIKRREKVYLSEYKKGRISRKTIKRIEEIIAKVS